MTQIIKPALAQLLQLDHPIELNPRMEGYSKKCYEDFAKIIQGFVDAIYESEPLFSPTILSLLRKVEESASKKFPDPNSLTGVVFLRLISPALVFSRKVQFGSSSCIFVHTWWKGGSLNCQSTAEDGKWWKLQQNRVYVMHKQIHEKKFAEVEQFLL